jgi:hypothetical protein
MAEEAKKDEKKEAAPPAPRVVDFDAGETWGKETIPLGRPFKIDGVTHHGIELRVPSGLDLARHRDSGGTLVDFAIGLSTLDAKVFNAMHAKDLATVLARANSFLS